MAIKEEDPCVCGHFYSIHVDGGPCTGAVSIMDRCHCPKFEVALEPAIVTNAAGGRQSRLDARYDLIPPFAEEIVAQVLAEGAEKYEPNNWQLIPSGDHLNHARQHITKFIQGDRSEDHAAHAATRIWFWLDMLQREGLRK